jgi:hypothetical protein
MFHVLGRFSNCSDSELTSDTKNPVRYFVEGEQVHRNASTYIGQHNTKKVDIQGSIQKFPDWVHNETCAYNSKHSLRSNTKGYGGKTH